MRKQFGFTLIEIMISMVIVSFIMLGVTQMFGQQAAISVSNEDEMGIQASSQGAIYMLRNSIVMSGFGRLSDDNSYAFTDTSGTTPGGDTLIINSAAQEGNSINTFMVSVAPMVTGNQFTFYCKGDNNTGGAVDPTRDVSMVTGFNTYILLKNAFSGKILTGIGPNPVMITADSGPNCIPHPAGVDLNNDGAPDPVVEITTAASISVPRGASVYGYRVMNVTYSLDIARSMLLQNGVPILWGVEDFQVQFQTISGACALAWCNSLVGIKQSEISQVAVGLVIRSARVHTNEAREPQTSITTFNHTLNLSAAAQTFTRKQFTFFARPRNNVY